MTRRSRRPAERSRLAAECEARAGEDQSGAGCLEEGETLVEEDHAAHRFDERHDDLEGAALGSTNLRIMRAVSRSRSFCVLDM